MLAVAVHGINTHHVPRAASEATQCLAAISKGNEKNRKAVLNSSNFHAVESLRKRELNLENAEIAATVRPLLSALQLPEDWLSVSFGGSLRLRREKLSLDGVTRSSLDGVDLSRPSIDGVSRLLPKTRPKGGKANGVCFSSEVRRDLVDIDEDSAGAPHISGHLQRLWSFNDDDHLLDHAKMRSQMSADSLLLGAPSEAALRDALGLDTISETIKGSAASGVFSAARARVAPPLTSHAVHASESSHSSFLASEVGSEDEDNDDWEEEDETSLSRFLAA
mmetsp:Transcript_20471/g.56762  ORF Transcript_20471/g.56762 Transcript_20471/m.56762 type:complete len:278 (-) Transcript_20471:60-893(-)